MVRRKLCRREGLFGPSLTKSSHMCSHAHTHRGTRTHRSTFQLSNGLGSGSRTLQCSPLLVKPQTKFLDSDSLSNTCTMSSRA